MLFLGPNAVLDKEGKPIIRTWDKLKEIGREDQMKYSKFDRLTPPAESIEPWSHPDESLDPPVN